MGDSGASSCIIVLFFVLLLIEAILFGFERAMHLMNEKEIERKATEEKDKKSIYLYEIIQRSTVYSNSIQMIITLIHVVMGCLYLPIWTDKFSQWLVKISFFKEFSEQGIRIIALVLASVCLMYIILTFATLLPKKLAQKSPDAWGYTFIRYMHVMKIMLYPLTGIVAKSTNGLLTVLGLRDSDKQADVTEEEIISMVNEGHEQGVLEASEAEMITNIFEFGDKEASDIMTNRSNVIAIDNNMPLIDALEFMLNGRNSRYPVYEENLDHIVGVLYLKDAMRIHRSDESLNKPINKIKGLIRDPIFVPETKNIDDLFRSMQSEKNQMVIVMDEYGQMSGLVTMEDILEEIVGNIMDEYDPDENNIEETGNNEYIIDGMTRLEDLEERFNIQFGDVEFETLNGYLVSRLDRIPDEDEHTEIGCNGYNFKIINVEKNVIQSVLVTKLPETDTASQDEDTKDA